MGPWFFQIQSLRLRNELIGILVNQAIAEGRLSLRPVNDETVVISQMGGIRHRREGLSYRLNEKRKAKQWIPKKRVEASNKIPIERKNIYKIREIIRDASHENFLIAKQNDNYDLFEKPMKKLIKRLRGPFLIRVYAKLKNIYSQFYIRPNRSPDNQ